MSVIKEQGMKAWMAWAMVAFLAGCASKRAVPVDCGRRLSPINVPAVIVDPVTSEPRAPEAPEAAEVPET
ncbi:MAG: hypothetical protein SXG53_29540 [Pseudomonadota bacterium]|nr:hypothetical protein [Pseudomonadota bacterium]